MFYFVIHVMIGGMISGCTFLNKQLHNDDSNSLPQYQNGGKQHFV